MIPLDLMVGGFLQGSRGLAMAPWGPTAPAVRPMEACGHNLIQRVAPFRSETAFQSTTVAFFHQFFGSLVFPLRIHAAQLLSTPQVFHIGHELMSRIDKGLMSTCQFQILYPALRLRKNELDARTQSFGGPSNLLNRRPLWA